MNFLRIVIKDSAIKITNIYIHIKKIVYTYIYIKKIVYIYIIAEIYKIRGDTQQTDTVIDVAMLTIQAMNQQKHANK